MVLLVSTGRYAVASALLVLAWFSVFAGGAYLADAALHGVGLWACLLVLAVTLVALIAGPVYIIERYLSQP